MQVLHIDKKGGVATVKVENPDDLWHLEKVLEPGDVITGQTLRKTAVRRGTEIEEGERRPLTVTIRLEKVNRDLNKLRLLGTIEAGPEDVQIHAHHSMHVELGSVVTIQKEWQSYQLDRLKKARSKPLMVICALDREEATIAGVKESGIEWYGSIAAQKFAKAKAVGAKHETGAAYFQAIAGTLAQRQDEFQLVILAGPGFEKENLADYIREKDPAMAKKVVTEQASYAGRTGVQEVVKTSANKLLRESRVARETGLVGKLLVEINKDGPVVYGKKETEKAVEMGAVDMLLVSDEKVAEMRRILDKEERLGGKIVVISSEHEAGEQFLGLGGIAGFLRFRV